jgi:purine-nucleoside phosphorylase
MENIYEKIMESLAYIRTQTQQTPTTGIILGTGLGNLTQDITDISATIAYKDIPYFPLSTVEGHSGKLIFGRLAGCSVVVMSGRFHYYEGYSLPQITFPVRVMKALGIENILITNVSGSTNADIEAGDLVFVRDHINLLPDNPLRGQNDERLGLRFPEMIHVYDKKIIKKGLKICKQNKIRAHKGVYASLQGPSLETPAEYEFLHRIGGDVVGMSTVPEVIVAKHCDLRIAVISLVCNKSYPTKKIKEATLEEVIKVATETEPKLRQVVKELLMSKHFRSNG